MTTKQPNAWRALTKMNRLANDLIRNADAAYQDALRYDAAVEENDDYYIAYHAEYVSQYVDAIHSQAKQIINMVNDYAEFSAPDTK